MPREIFLTANDTTPLEDRRNFWSVQQVEEVLSNQRPAILIARVSVLEARKKLHSFTNDSTTTDKDFVDAMFDDEGNILVTHWREIIPEIDENGNRTIPLPEDDDYVILKPKNRTSDYLHHLPKRIPVARLEVLKTDGIEKAMRQQMHILDHYSQNVNTSEMSKARKVLEFTKFISCYLTQNRRLNSEELDHLDELVDTLTSQIGLDRAETVDKTQLLEELDTASEPVLGRPNYLVTLSKIGAAESLALIWRTKAHIVLSKFSTILEVLSSHREQSRMALEFASGYLQLLYFHLGHPEVYLNKNQILEIIRNISAQLKIPKTKPYLKEARYVDLRLLGISKNRKVQDKILFGDGGLIQFERESTVAQLIKDGKYSEAASEIRFCLDHLSYALTQNEAI